MSDDKIRYQEPEEGEIAHSPYGGPHDHEEDDAPARSSELDDSGEDNDEMHPGAITLFRVCPALRYVPVFGESVAGYGPKAVVSLGLSYILLKGFANQLLNGVVYAILYLRLGLDVDRYMRLSNVAQLGWSLNALTASVCDTFALFGYTKRWYMCFSCILGGAFAVAVGGIAKKHPHPKYGNLVGALLFLSNFGKANVDILSEGHYTRMLRKWPRHGPALVSWVSWGSMIGTICSSAVVGPVSDRGYAWVCAIVAGCLQIVAFILFAANMYEERRNAVDRAEDELLIHAHHEDNLARQELFTLNGRIARFLFPCCFRTPYPEQQHYDNGAETQPPYRADGSEEGAEALQGNPSSDDDGVSDVSEEELVRRSRPIKCLFVEINQSVVRRDWMLYIPSFIMTAVVVGLTVANIYATSTQLLIVLCVCGALIIVSLVLTLPFTIAKAAIFGFLQMVTEVTVWGASVPFYQATPDCLPDGPHFSLTFYSTVGPIVGNVAGLVGVAGFYYIFSHWKYRAAFLVTTFIGIFGNVFDIIIVKRWNIIIGIPDKAMYLFGNAVVYDVCYMMAAMPMLVLISRLCPRGSESMVFALIAGLRAVGQNVASAIGVVVTEKRFPVTGCDYHNLPWLLFVCRILCPLLIIPCLPLVPNARLDEEIDADGRPMPKMTAAQRRQARRERHEQLVGRTTARKEEEEEVVEPRSSSEVRVE